MCFLISGTVHSGAVGGSGALKFSLSELIFKGEKNFKVEKTSCVGPLCDDRLTPLCWPTVLLEGAKVMKDCGLSLPLIEVLAVRISGHSPLRNCSHFSLQTFHYDRDVVRANHLLDLLDKLDPIVFNEI